MIVVTLCMPTLIHEYISVRCGRAKRLESIIFHITVGGAEIVPGVLAVWR